MKLGGSTTRHIVIVAGLAIVALTALASTAQGVITGQLETYRLEIDVKMTASEHSKWNGIRPGCYAPGESFDNKLTARIDSTPSSKSKILAGTATLLPGSFGATASFGAKGSFRQSSKAGSWELQIKDPPSCNTKDPEIPPWATSPTCKKVNERVMVSLIQNSDTAPSKSPTTDGSMLITRVKGARPNGVAKNVGASCVRTMHTTKATGVDSEFDFGLTNTFVQIPVPGLRTKLGRLKRGGDRSRPSFTVKVGIDGDCGAMRISPFIGLRGATIFRPQTTPHQALGSIDGDYSKSTCTTDGDGRVIFRRVGPVVSTNYSPKF